MKPKLVLTGFVALTFLAILSAVHLGRSNLSRRKASSGGQTFQVRGQIRSINAAEKTIRIAHDAIPNYMPAMTMPLPVKDPTLLNHLAAGQEVQFELRVTENDSWISQIQSLPSEAQATQAETGAGGSLDDLEAERLRAGDLVPDFTLTNQDGHAIHLSEFRGKAVVLTFIYTRCPLPNFCPLMSRNFAELEQRLGKEFPHRFHLLSISMDPEFDQPGVLKDYAEQYAADPKDWTFATGDAAAINFVAKLLGLYFEKENGLISHDLRTALIGPDGRLVQLWKSNVWTPYEVQRGVRETLTSQPDVASR